jgi:hypothetical protein
LEEALERMSVWQVRKLAETVRDAGRCEVWAHDSYDIVHGWLMAHAPKALVGDLVAEAEWERAYEAGDEDLDVEGMVAEGLAAMVATEPRYVEAVLRGLAHPEVNELVWNQFAHACEPHALIGLVELARDTLGQPGFGSLVSRLSEALAGDPEAEAELAELVPEIAGSLESDRATAAVIGKARGLGKSDPAAGWRFVAEIADARLRQNALFVLLDAVTDAAARERLAAQILEDGGFKGFDPFKIAHDLASSAPLVAAAWARGIGDGDARTTAMTMVAYGIAKQHPDEALALAEELPSLDWNQGSWTARMLDVAVDVNVRDCELALADGWEAFVVQWSAIGRGTVRDGVLAKLAPTLASQFPQQAAAHLAGLTGTRAHSDAIASFADAWRQADGGSAALEWLGQLTPAGFRSEIALEVFGRWTNGGRLWGSWVADTDRAFAWAVSEGVGVLVREPTLLAALNDWAGSEPEAAVQWLRGLGRTEAERSLVETGVRAAVRELAGVNPALARQVAGEFDLGEAVAAELEEVVHERE